MEKNNQIKLVVGLILLAFISACGKSNQREFCEKNMNLKLPQGLNASQEEKVKLKIIDFCTEATSRCSSKDLENIKDKFSKIIDIAELETMVSKECFEGMKTFGSDIKNKLGEAIKDALKQ